VAKWKYFGTVAEGFRTSLSVFKFFGMI